MDRTSVAPAGWIGPSRQQKPLPLSLKGLTLAEAADFVSVIFLESEDAGISIHQVDSAPELFDLLSAIGVDRFGIVADNKLVCEAAFWEP